LPGQGKSPNANAWRRPSLCPGDAHHSLQRAAQVYQSSLAARGRVLRLVGIGQLYGSGWHLNLIARPVASH
jgi:hypothetical protein